MKTLLKSLVAFAIVSNALCLDLGHLLGLRRDWRDLSNEPANPKIIEVVRWRQPVCVVPGPGVPPCVMTLKKNQEEYERNSAKGIETNQPEKPKRLIATEQKKIKKEIQSAFPGLGRDIEADIAQWCFPYLTGSGDSRSQSQDENDWNSDYEICDEIEWVRRSERTQDMELEKANSKIVGPHLVNSVSVEGVDLVKLEGSEISGRSNFGHTVTMNLESRTPRMEEAQADRQGRYLLISGIAKNAQPVQSPPAIYVTKVLNSPVTATLVANNCFPDIGVPLCDEYQETLTIYQGTTVEDPDRHDTMDKSVEGFPTAMFLQANAEQESESLGEGPEEEVVQENTESLDFWNDPNNPHFNNGSSSNETTKPAGLLEQAVNHVLNKPGVINSIPPGVIEAIANNPAVLDAVANAGNAGESTTGNNRINVTQIKPHVVVDPSISETVTVATTSKPGFISSFLDIQRPGILNNFWNPGFGLFNRSTTAKPAKLAPGNGTPNSPANGHFGSGLLGQGGGQRPVIEAIQNLIHKPETVNTNATPEFQPVLVIERPQKPGLFGNLWNSAGGFGLFNRRTTTTRKPFTTSTEEPNVFISEGAEEPQPKPTKAPGIFGGFFSNPSRPTATDISGNITQGLLGIGSSIFSRPTNKPLIIARPGAKPLLVQKPIYVQEKPAQNAGLLNFFIPSNDKPVLNVDHEVITEPVYVYQKPQTAAGLFSNVFSNVAKPTFFQGWAIFGHPQETPANQTNKPPQQNHNTTTNVDESATSSQKPEGIIVIEEIEEPEEIEETEESEEEPTFTNDETPKPFPDLPTSLDLSSSTTEIIPEESEEIFIKNSSPSEDIANISNVKDEIKADEVAVEPEVIHEDHAKIVAEDSTEEAKSLGEESVIDNEA